MCDRPLVSVVISTYLHEKYLAKTLSSVLSQGVEALEVIILDDCSPDRTRDVVEPFLDDPRVSYIRHEKNLGSKANNTLALQSGKGKYLCWLNGDDYFLPGHLQAYLDVMEAHPECALIYSPCYWVDETGRIIKLARHPGHVEFDYAGGRNEAAELLAWDNYITPSAAMFRRSELEQVGNLDPVIRAADWDLFLRVALHNSNFAFLARPSTAYRIHSGQYSHEFYASIEPLRAHLHVFEKAFQTLGRRGLSGYKTEIANLLEQRVKAYSLEQLQTLAAELQRGCEQLTALSDSGEPEPLQSEPLVSIIVPTKDRPELLQDTLASVNAQCYTNWELVVVNDGGADVGELVRELDVHSRFRYLRHPVSCGLPAARNTGIRFSRGAILCYLDDDDTFRPEHLQTVVSALCENQAEFVYAEAEYIHEEVIDGERREVSRSTPYSGMEYSRDQLHVANFIPVNTWAHRRELLEQAGLFDCELNAFEDWDLLLRFSQLVDFVHVPRLTVEVHMRSGMPDQHMTQRERKNYPALYRKLYERYPVMSTQAKAARERQLDALGEDQSQSGQETGGYQKWIAAHNITERDLQHYAQQMMTGWTMRPSFHFVMTYVRGQEEAFADTLDSLGAQLYGGWGLSVVSNEPCPDNCFSELGMLEWLQVEGEPLPALNKVAGESGADWMVMVEAGTVFEPHFLYACVEALHQNPDFHLLYTDEDWIDRDGRRYDPLFKPDFNLELLRSMPYLGNLLLVKRDGLMDTGGYSPVLGATAYEVAFRVVERFGAEAVGHIADVLAHRQDRFQLAVDEQAIAESRRACVAAHLKRCGVDAEVKHGALFGSYFVDYACQRKPAVDILVAVSAATAPLDLLLGSLQSHTAYADCRAHLLLKEGLELPEFPPGETDIRLHTFSDPDLLWGVVRDIVRESDAEYLLLMSPGCIAIQEHWLDRLVAQAEHSGAAVVAPRLISSDRKVLGSGLILGGGTSGIGSGAFDGLSIDESGYMGRAQVAQELSAVPASCMLVRKSVYEAVGGLSSALRIPLYQSVDFCLRVRAHGGRIVWTPHSTMLYTGDDASALSDIDLEETVRKESETLCKRALPVLANDPAYNKNLRLVGEKFSVEADFIPAWSREDRSLKRIIGFGSGSLGSCKYRVEQPLRAMHRERVSSNRILPFSATAVRLPSATELQRIKPDALLMHNTIYEGYMDAIERYKKLNDVFIAFGQDDLIFDLPAKNPFSKTVYKDAKKRLRRCFALADRVIVSTVPLAEALGAMTGEIKVVPNYLDDAIWGGLVSQRGVSEKPRVGWAGALQHGGDLELLEEVVRLTADEVDWVFLGMCPSALRPYVKESHDPVEIALYPGKLASLNLDLAVAPLEHNRFNVCKSNLRLLEYGVLGWPVVASDIAPYRDAPVCRVPNQPRAWINAIRERIHNLDAARREGDELRSWVRGHWMLQQHLDEWLAALVPDSDSGQKYTAQNTAAG